MHCWSRYLLLAVVVALGTGQLLAACGQKGNLFLPPPEAKAKASKPAPTGSQKPRAPAQPQGTGEGLQILDEVPSTRPDPSGF